MLSMIFVCVNTVLLGRKVIYLGGNPPTCNTSSGHPGKTVVMGRKHGRALDGHSRSVETSL